MTVTTALTRLIETDAHEGPVYAPDEHALYFTTNRPSGRDRAARPRHARRRPRSAPTPTGERHDARPRRLRCSSASRARLAARGRSPASTADRARRARSSTRWLRAAAELAERRRRRARRRDLVHRPELRLPAGLPPAAASSATPSTATTPRPARRRVVADALRQAQRPRVLARRARALRRRQRRATTIKAFDVARTGATTSRRRRASVAVIAPGLPGRHQGRRRGAGLRLGRRRRARLRSPTGDALGEIPLPGAVNFAFGGPDATSSTSPPTTAVWAAELDLDLTERSTTMLVRTRKIIDDAGAEAVARRRRAPRPRRRQPRRDRRRRPVGRARRAAPHAWRPGGQLARRGRQGAHGGDLRPAEPRDGAAGHRRPDRRARAARRRRA